AGRDSRPAAGRGDWHDSGVPDIPAAIRLPAAATGGGRWRPACARARVGSGGVPAVGSGLKGAVFEHPVDVRWRDVDALDHVNHAVFLTYLEEGRDAFFAQTLGSDPSYVVVRIEVDLRAEVRLADRRVVVRIAAERLGTTSLTTRETITTPSGEVAAEAVVVTVRWDEDRHQPVPFTPAERAPLRAAMPG